MAITIKDEHVIALVLRLAEQCSVNPTEAIRLAVEHELERRESRSAPKRERLRAIARRIAMSPIRDARPIDDLLGYDEHGLPR